MEASQVEGFLYRQASGLQSALVTRFERDLTVARGYSQQPALARTDLVSIQRTQTSPENKSIGLLMKQFSTSPKLSSLDALNDEHGCCCSGRNQRGAHSQPGDQERMR